MDETPFLGYHSHHSPTQDNIINTQENPFRSPFFCLSFNI